MMGTGWGMLDGHVAPLSDISIPVTDRGVLLGDAVFETLRTYDGRLFALDDHLERLDAGLAALRFVAPPERAVLAEEARRLAAHAHAEAGPGEALVLRITVTRGSGPRGLSPAGAGPPRRLLMAMPFTPPDDAWYRQGVAVMTAETRRTHVRAQDPRIKATSALNLLLARLEADAAGVEDALLRDDQGAYLESTAANLVVLRGRSYHAPRGGDGVLPGVTAAKVMQILDDMGWHAVRGPIAPEVLRSADEVWLTQTSRELIPVTRIDDARVGAGTEGPVARAVRDRFRKEVPRWLEP